MARSAAGILSPHGFHASRRGVLAGVALVVIVLHALVLLGLPAGVGPVPAAGGVRALEVRQIVAPPNAMPAVAGGAPREPAATVPVPARGAPAATVPAPLPVAPPRAEPLPAAATPRPDPAAAAPEAGDPDAETGAARAADGARAAVAAIVAGGRPLPVYPTRAPGPALLAFELRRGLVTGSAELQWRPDGEGRYELALLGRLGGVEAIGWTSRGHLVETGLAPERFVIRRRGRERHAANFQRDSGRITFSGPAAELPLVPGVQDRVSWLVQLGAILQADPARGQAGATIEMLVVGARGDAEVWTFSALGPGRIDLPAGPVEGALHFRREAARPYDTSAEVWLDPARGHLPVRARLWARPGAADAIEFVLAAP